MRLFRVLGQKEKNALLESKNILKQHETCKVPRWILNPHPEDYQTGKYFFFELEDVLKYAKETYGSRKACYLLEINIDASLIFPYLGYGVYCYADYEESGRWNNNLSHCIPEALLPYQVIDKEIKTNSYKLTNIDNNALLNFHTPNAKHRNPALIKLGKTICKLCCAKRNAEEIISSVNTRCMQYSTEELEKAQQTVNELENLLLSAYESFTTSHRNYNSQLSDFLQIQEFAEDTFEKNI